jgi:hypothetical protein
MDLLVELLELSAVRVIDNRQGLGVDPQLIYVRFTDTEADQDGTKDLNAIIIPTRAAAYIRRNGETWLFDSTDPALVIYVARSDHDTPYEIQDTALTVLLSGLKDQYGLDVSAAPEEEPVVMGGVLPDSPAAVAAAASADADEPVSNPSTEDTASEPGDQGTARRPARPTRRKAKGSTE